MQYTDEEIRRAYENAADKKQQVKILAELNGCTAGKIREILFGKDAVSGGEVSPKNRTKEFWDAVMADVDGGMSVEDAAAKYGLPKAAINRTVGIRKGNAERAATPGGKRKAETKDWKDEVSSPRLTGDELKTLFGRPPSKEGEPPVKEGRHPGFSFEEFMKELMKPVGDESPIEAATARELLAATMSIDMNDLQKTSKSLDAMQRIIAVLGELSQDDCAEVRASTKALVNALMDQAGW